MCNRVAEPDAAGQAISTQDAYVKAQAARRHVPEATIDDLRR